MKWIRTLLLLLLPFLASSCATYRAVHERQPQALAEYKRYWVRANFDDNRAMAMRIVRALRERGYEVDAGPMTMMPRTAQVVVHYKDQWAWDFREHLVGLELRLTDAKTEGQLAVASYSGAAAMFTNPSEAVEGALRELFEGKGRVRKVTDF